MSRRTSFQPIQPSVLRPLKTAGLPLLLLLSFVFGSSSAARSEESPDGGGPGREQLLAHKCELCHGVAAAGIKSRAKTPKMEGPDLSGYGTDDPEALSAYLRKQKEQNGEKHKREFKGSDEELQQILDWLGSLEAAREEDSAAEDGGA